MAAAQTAKRIAYRAKSEPAVAKRRILATDHTDARGYSRCIADLGPTESPGLRNRPRNSHVRSVCIRVIRGENSFLAFSAPKATQAIAQKVCSPRSRKEEFSATDLTDARGYSSGTAYLGPTAPAGLRTAPRNSHEPSVCIRVIRGENSFLAFPAPKATQAIAQTVCGMPLAYPLSRCVRPGSGPAPMDPLALGNRMARSAHCHTTKPWTPRARSRPTPRGRSTKE